MVKANNPNTDKNKSKFTETASEVQNVSSMQDVCVDRIALLQRM